MLQTWGKLQLAAKLKLRQKTRDKLKSSMLLDDHRQRAIRLLEQFFEASEPRERRSVFSDALDPHSPPLVRRIEYTTTEDHFARNAVDKLLEHGSVGRGRHALSVLLAKMSESAGSYVKDEYLDLQLAFDAQCTLPSRDERTAHLNALIAKVEKDAERYSPLRGVGTVRPADVPDLDMLSLWERSYVTHMEHTCHPATPVKSETQPFNDIVKAHDVLKRAALLGAPGAGKSTTLRRLAVNLSKRALTDSKQPLPLLASLGLWKGNESLAAYLESEAPHIAWALEELCRKNRIILLFDGLNEMAPSKIHEVRDMLHKAPVWVSCRKEDYTGEFDLGLDSLELKPLTPPQVRAAVTKWVTAAGKPAAIADRFFFQLAGDEALAAVWKKWDSAEATEDEFWSVSQPFDHQDVYWATTHEDRALWQKHVNNPRCLVRLAANPLLLTMFFQLWIRKGGVLPQNRGSLFDGFVQDCMNNERISPQERERLLHSLAGLAWQTQRANPEIGSLVVIHRPDVVAALGETLLKKAQDATLLEGGDQLRFRHQQLQEYFVARALRDRMQHTPASDLWPRETWWERTGWEETAVLLAGIHSNDCTPVIRWLADAQPEVAAQCIEESGAGPEDKRSLLAELSQSWMPRLLDEYPEPQIKGRAAIGRALGRLNLDHRPGVGLKNGVPDIDWVAIPRVDFEIARYPVTNAQFKAFLDAKDGYTDDRWWKGVDKEHRTPSAGYWSESNHPRETVSWYEARAFCAWLSTKLGHEVRLPTEHEWERAARGAEGRTYPWGNEYVRENLNTEFTMGRTTAVGLYPKGASKEGVLDLSGNVWEWCSNTYEKGGNTRVLRGGSWSSISQNARADSRDYVPPLNRDSSIGFRVVRSAPIR